ncbi:TetR/AcrR family transcriptional regulator [Streptomyces phytohabitans]|uniref:TetR/AcrR family transcriptional regulator n=1 Tax=Streptomyces phytohabitans TaxID=1150371 RepID=UPI00345B4E48
MPKIRGASIEEHHERVWADLAEALRQLLRERDYGSLTMGHIAARAGLARNTLYNYGRDKDVLVRALAQRAARPLVARVAALAAQPSVPAAERLREIVAAVLEASTEPGMQLMFQLGPGLPVADCFEERSAGEPGGDAPENPFHAVAVEVRQVVRDGVARGEFRDVGGVSAADEAGTAGAGGMDGTSGVDLLVELLSGVLRSGGERLGRDPSLLAATTRTAQDIVLASLARHP